MFRFKNHQELGADALMPSCAACARIPDGGVETRFAVRATARAGIDGNHPSAGVAFSCWQSY